MKALLDQSFPTSIATMSHHGHLLTRCDDACSDQDLIRMAANDGFDVVVMLGDAVLADESLLNRCTELKIALAATVAEDPVIGGNHVTANLPRLARIASPGAVLVIKAREVTPYPSQTI